MAKVEGSSPFIRSCAARPTGRAVRVFGSRTGCRASASNAVPVIDLSGERMPADEGVAPHFHANEPVRTIARVDDPWLRILLDEIRMQCEIVELAAVFLEHAIAHGPAPGEDPAVLVWMPLQAILGAAANISRLCWGSGRKKTQRLARAAELAPLRDLLELDDASPLAPVQIGPGFDRIDRRLKDLVGDLDSAVRRFDDATWEAGFLGDSVRVRELGIEVSRVLGRTRELLALPA
jgi:hypothetical protein